MAITPMTFKVEISDQEWALCPMRNKWLSIPLSDPIYGSSSFKSFLKLEYNIHVKNIEPYNIHTPGLMVIFESEQDYILWQLYQ